LGFGLLPEAWRLVIEGIAKVAVRGCVFRVQLDSQAILSDRLVFLALITKHIAQADVVAP
jgi:hypothetical protein